MTATSMADTCLAGLTSYRTRGKLPSDDFKQKPSVVAFRNTGGKNIRSRLASWILATAVKCIGSFFTALVPVVGVFVSVPPPGGGGGPGAGWWGWGGGGLLFFFLVFRYVN